MVRVFLGLGSNEGSPLEQIDEALRELPQRGVALVRASSRYRTEPVGGPPQPWYVNAVAEVGFRGAPSELLWICRTIESHHGRRRVVENGPRTLDLDILLFSDLELESSELAIPHPRFRDRRFVLVPMVEIAPEVVDPVSGLTMRELLSRCADESRVVPISESEPLSAGA
ncbi:MAG: 2-amino-4-hydroxy-6-hydroxymethyldihydropteridine diphosphokinase [Vicinamibacteria bacterium]